MHIAVIAADGRTGRAFVQAALDAGHHVRAGIRGKSTFAPHSSLEVVQCEATNEAQVERLLKNQDAVASFIGHVPHSPASVQTEAMRVVCRVMRRLGVRRIVSLTGTGVRASGDHIPLLDRLVTLFIKIIDPARLKDGIDHVNVLQASGLEWTVLRVLKLQNTRPRPFSLKEHGPTKWYVSRQEVAAAALQLLTERTYVHSMPIIAKR